MKSTTVIREVAWRDLSARVRSKAFVISTGFMLIVVLALAIIPGLVNDDGPTRYDVGVAGSNASNVEALGNALRNVGVLAGGDVTLDVRTLTNRQEAEQLVTSDDLDVAVIEANTSAESAEVVVHKELSDELALLLQEAVRQVQAVSALTDAGIDDPGLVQALAPQPLAVQALDPPDDAETDREGLVFVGTLLLYGQLLGFGVWVATGIVEEKSSRVVELLLAKAKPTELLTGKIIGIGVVGFVQLVAFVVVGLVAAQLSGTVDLPSGTIRVAFEVLGWFVLGYVLYSCLYAAGGALASRAEELQSTTTPITVLVIAAFFAAIFAQGDPNGGIATVASFLPPSAPLVLPIRSAAGELPVWQLVLSVAIVLGSIVLAVRFASRVFAGGSLHTRGQMKLRDALSAGGRPERATSTS